ncbi:MAG: hypothetical protein KGI06_02490 [Candidatus Micrarchaeota archaeon]|nr:hypothetical protein [Candidatus Micrarchaeota archaeon]
MIYKVRMNRRLSNVKVYVVLKRQNQRKQSFMTKLFMKIFRQENKGTTSESAVDRLR